MLPNGSPPISRLIAYIITDLTVRYKPVLFLADNRVVSCHKPLVS